MMLLQLLTYVYKYHLGLDVRWTRRERGSRRAPTLSERMKISREHHSAGPGPSQARPDVIPISSPILAHTHSHKHRLRVPALLRESNRVQRKRRRFFWILPLTVTVNKAVSSSLLLLDSGAETRSRTLFLLVKCGLEITGL